MRPKIALALSSGGWRGLAHVGVIKALVEASIPIDIVCGCSAGALIGGLYAAFKDIDKVEKIVRSVGYKDMIRTLFDPARNGGLLKGKKYQAYLKNILKDIHIKDLDIDFNAVSTNLLTGKPFYFSKGSLVTAIRASSSVPLVFKPVTYQNKLLIDGAASVVVPVDRCFSMGADFVIAVNVYGTFFPIPKPKKTTRTFYNTRLASFSMLKNLADYNCESANFVINPPIDKADFKIFKSFVSKKYTIDDSYQYTLKRIPEIKKLLNRNINK